MVELTTCSINLKRKVAIKGLELVTMKNGRRALREVAAGDPSSKVFRIVSDKQAEEIRGMLG